MALQRDVGFECIGTFQTVVEVLIAATTWMVSAASSERLLPIAE